MGTLYTLEEMEALRAACDKWHLILFIDGVRSGYGLSAPGNDVTLRDIAHIADVFYIAGTKVGAFFEEALVIGNETIQIDFRYRMKQNCGIIAKKWLHGIQFEVLFASVTH